MPDQHNTGGSARLSSADSLLWRIESDPVLRSTIVVVGVLDRVPDWDAVATTFDRAQALVPRLRQRVATGPLGRLRWQEVAVDPAFHLRLIRLPEPGGLRTLLDVAEPLATEAFDPARPLWEVIVADGLDGDRSGLILKLHHAITDGVGGVALASMLFDGGDAFGPAVTADAPGTSPPWSKPLGDALRFTESVGAAAMHPLSTLRSGARLVASVGRLLAPAHAPLSPVMRGRGLGRSFHVLDLPFASVQAAADAVDGTINDVFLAAVGGAVARYHDRAGVALPAMRVTVPINMRRPDDPLAGNHFTPARFELPIAADDPAERAQQAGAAVRGWRAEPAVGLTDALAGVLDLLPTPVVTALFQGLLRNVDVDAANVPGIRQPVSIGDARIERLWAFAPPSGAACSVTLLSHVDRCCVALSADTTAVKDPGLLANCLEASWSQVSELAERGTPAGLARAG
jgi:WS/DGAT/MGAT family acyltransferase